MTYKIGILDDHPVLAHGLHTLLSRNGFEVRWIAHSMKDALSKLDSDTDLVLTDIQLPDGDGMEFCKNAKKRFPDLKLLALSSYSDSSFVRNMLKNGASAYLLKESDERLILEAIQRVCAGETYIDPKIEATFIQFGLASHANKTILTRREKEVLNLLADGMSSRDMADKLFLSVKTVEAHRTNLLLKLDVKNVAQLIARAYELGLL